MGKVVSIITRKGGVAKTTTAKNLGNALVLRGEKVLFIDFDGQAHLTKCCGIIPNTIKNSIFELMTDRADINECIISLSDSLDIIAGNTLIKKSEDIVRNIAKDLILEEKLSPIINDYDYIIIDNSADIGFLTNNSVMASDYVICPCLPEYLPCDGIEEIATYIKSAMKVNYRLQFMGVLISLYRKCNMHNEVSDFIKNNYPSFNSVVKASIKFAEASLQKMSIMEYAGMDFDGSIAFMNLADEVINYEKNKKQY